MRGNKWKLLKMRRFIKPVSGSLPDLTVDGLSIRDKKKKKFSNLYIRKILTKEKKQVFFLRRWWSGNRIILSESVVNKYVISNKVKETKFKIMCRFYPCNDFISKFKEGFSSLCWFCLHLIYQLYVYQIILVPTFLVSFWIVSQDRHYSRHSGLVFGTGILEMDNIIKILVLSGKYHMVWLFSIHLKFFFFFVIPFNTDQS